MRQLPLPTSRLVGAPASLETLTYADFLLWAFADPCNDALKGIFCEWLLTRLLGSSSVRRILWANSDLITASGVRIEVKASAYWQDWKLLNEDGSDGDHTRWKIQPD